MVRALATTVSRAVLLVALAALASADMFVSHRDDCALTDDESTKCKASKKRPKRGGKEGKGKSQSGLIGRRLDSQLNR